MKSVSRIDMAEVTRLTRSGQLEKAMQLLRGGSGARDDAQPHSKSAAPNAADTSNGRPDIIDMDPPSPTNGGAWTASAPHAHANSPAQQSSAGAFANTLNSTLQSTLSRMQKPRMRVGLRAAQTPMDIPPGARYETRINAGLHGTREYTVYVPSSYDATPRALVVMLHGCTQSPDDFARGTGMNHLAEQHGFIVAYPAQSQAANPSRCWNWFNTGDQQRDQGEPSLIAGITRTLISEFSIDPRRVYVAGLSAGGAMAAILGDAYPDLYAAVGVHSGLATGAAQDLPSALEAMRNGGPKTTARATRAGGVPTIVLHGDADATVNPVNADRVASQIRGGARAHCQASTGTSPGGIAFTRTVDTDSNGEPLVEQWVLHGAGHAWSGGHASGSFVEPRGPDASSAMWAFFSAHPNARQSSR